MAEIEIKGASDSSSTFVSNLPYSLIVEILIKLPIKNIVRFRCVCKTWKNLVSNKYFCALYLKNPPFTLFLRFKNGTHHGYDSGILYYDKSYPIQFDFVEIGSNGDLSFTPAYLPDNFPRTCIRIVSSSNGLLCFVNHEECNSEVIYIMNPIFGDLVMLPRVYHNFYERVYGFGFCKESDHYKVLRMYSYKERRVQIGGKILCEILTIGVDHEWRSLEDSSFKFGILSHHSSITHEGMVYFICRDRNKINGCTIFAFDLENEKGRLVSFPSEQIQWPHLWLCDGNLCLTNMDKDGDLVTWTMKRSGSVESWSKSILEKTSSIQNFPLTNLRNGDMLMSWENDKIPFYNGKTKMIRMVNEPCGYGGYNKFFGYVPNFVPLSTDDIVQEYCESLNTSNALDILEISKICSYPSLEEAAMNFILRNIKDVAFSERYEEFTRDNHLLAVQITRALLSDTNLHCQCRNLSPHHNTE